MRWGLSTNNDKQGSEVFLKNIFYYLHSVKERQFSHALAYIPIRWRFLTPNQQWMAMRLGLYETVANKPFAITKKQAHSQLIARAKTHKTNRDTIELKIVDYFYNKSYISYQKEFVKELIVIYPEIIYKCLSQHEKSLDDDYYLGVYLVLSSSIMSLCEYSVFCEKYKDRSIEEFALIKHNHANISKVAKISALNDFFSRYQLAPLGLVDETQPFCVTNLKPATTLQQNMNTSSANKVSIVVTCFNSEETIYESLMSLILQTWQNLEIIVVDDCSEDHTLNIIKKLQSEHPKKIKLIALPCNVGTFVAKSIGAKYATGEFLTCQDSDDWAHPQKIYRQVKPLIDRKSLMVTVSYWIRLNSKGLYHARQVYPLMRQNPASPLFRRNQVEKDMGLWHLVRTGADSEFWERLKLNYGNSGILTIKEPLTIASHRENSLMTSSTLGAYTTSGQKKRQQYWQAWRIWHIEQLSKNQPLIMPTVEKQILCEQTIQDIPESIIVDRKKVQYALDFHRAIL